MEKIRGMGLEKLGRLPKVPFTHMEFNFAQYYMSKRDIEKAAEHFYEVLETSPFRYCEET